MSKRPKDEIDDLLRRGGPPYVCQFKACPLATEDPDKRKLARHLRAFPKCLSDYRKFVELKEKEGDAPVRQLNVPSAAVVSGVATLPPAETPDHDGYGDTNHDSASDLDAEDFFSVSQATTGGPTIRLEESPEGNPMDIDDGGSADSGSVGSDLNIAPVFSEDNAGSIANVTRDSDFGYESALLIDDDRSEFEGSLLLDDEPSTSPEFDESAEDDNYFDEDLANQLLDLSLVQDGNNQNYTNSHEDEYEDVALACALEIPSSFQKHDALLLHLIKEKNVPPSIFDDVMDWAKNAHDEGYQFGSMRYRTVMKNMIDHYVPKECTPVEKYVDVPGVPKTKMYVFPIIPQIKRLLANPDFVKDGLWHYDEKRVPSEVEGVAGERIYGESNTGRFWEEVEKDLRQHLIGNGVNEALLDNHSPMIICPFDDNANCDALGRLTCQMVMATILNIPGAQRRNADAYFPVGIIPPYPKTSAERERDSRRIDSKHNYLKFYHTCLKNIWEDLLTMEKEYQFIKVRLPTSDNQYEYRCLYPSLGHIIGDTKGHDDMCCHYNSHSSVIKQMNRDCDIPQDRGDDVDYACKQTNMHEIKELQEQYRDAETPSLRKEIFEKLKSRFSYHPVPSYYNLFRFGNLLGGIAFPGTPYEVLHLWYLGIMKLILIAIFSICTIPQDLHEWFQQRLLGNPEGALQKRPAKQKKSTSRTFPCAEFEERLRNVQMASRRQSDRDMPRTPFKHGVTSLTRLNGQEYGGLCLLAMACLKGIFHKERKSRETKYRTKLKSKDKKKLSEKDEETVQKQVDDEIKKEVILEKQLTLLLFLSLSLLGRMQAETFTESTLKKLEDDMKCFLRFFRATLGIYVEALSATGLRRCKFHAPIHIFEQIRYLGTTHNFFGGYLEALQKTLVKQPCERTSRKHSSFQREILQRHVELVAVKRDKDARLLAIKQRQEQDRPPEEIRLNNMSQAASTITSNRSFLSSSSENQWSKRFECSKPKFSLQKNRSGNWCTYVGAKEIGSEDVTHPDYHGCSDVGGDHSPTAWLRKFIAKAEEENKKFDKIEFMNKIVVPDIHSGKHEIFRAQKVYQGYEWQDWCQVKFRKKTRSGEQVYETSAKILQWGLMTMQDENLMPKEVRPLFAVVHPFASNGEPPMDDILPVGRTDILSKDLYLVNFEEINSVAYVLPVNRRRDEAFPKSGDNSPDSSTAFWSVPQRSLWSDLGWDNKLLKPYRKKMQPYKNSEGNT